METVHGRITAGGMDWLGAGRSGKVLKQPAERSGVSGRCASAPEISMKKKKMPTKEWQQRKREQKARKFYDEMQSRACGCHVSLRGLDSIALFDFI